MVSIMRGDGYVHPTLGIGHDVVKKFSLTARQEGISLLSVALRDEHFAAYFSRLSDLKRSILNGDFEEYVGSAYERAAINREYARGVAGRT